MMPRVSVIIPYNKDRGFLFQAVDSVLRQTYADVECVPSFGDGLVGVNFNNGLKRATGEYVMVCAEDDFLELDAVENLVAGMDGFDFVCANAYIWTDGKRVEYKSQVPRNHLVLIEYNSIHGGTVMYRKSVLDAIGGMDESLWTAEEYDMNVRLLKAGYKLGKVEAFVHNNRIHGMSKSKQWLSDPQMKFERIMYIEKIKSGLR